MRREVLRKTTQLGAVWALFPEAIAGRAEEAGVEVNDSQSQRTPRASTVSFRRSPSRRSRPPCGDAQKEGRAVSVAGGRHAMGGQQFGRDTSCST